jgi:hypothetical protein
VLLHVDVEAIGTELEKYLDFIVEADMKRNPGGRIIKGVVVGHFELISWVLNQQSLSGDEVKRVIENSICISGVRVT